MVERLVEPVELELVYSRGLGADFPAVRAHAERVRELMKEIAARSNGHVKLRETDPEPSPKPKTASPPPVSSPHPPTRATRSISASSASTRSTTASPYPYLAPERDAMLEYELVRLIAQLDDPAPPKVAVISSLAAFQGDGSGAGRCLRAARDAPRFEVVPVDPNFRALPPGADILMMVHPGPLDEWQTYVVDQFPAAPRPRHPRARSGLARLLATEGRRAFASSGLGKLSETLGVTLGKEAAADRALALPIEIDARGDRRRDRRPAALPRRRAR